MDFQIMEFDETTLEDFQDVILPGVLAELLSMDDFAEEGIIAIGAMSKEEPVGAVIARLLNNTQVQILSLYVVQDARRNGIAVTMLDGLASLCFELFDNEEQWEVPVGIGIDYVMDDELLEGFEAFLQKAGFGYHEERLPVCIFKASLADSLPENSEARELPEDEYFEEWLEEAGLVTEPELCIYTGQEENPSCILAALDAGDGSYDLISYSDESCSDDQFAPALKHLLKKLDRDADIYADSMKNVCPEFLKQTAIDGGRILTHRFAEHRMIIEKE